MLTYQDCKELDHKGSKNPGWKGSSASYHSKHQYLKRNYGSPKYCEICGVEGRKEKGGRWSIHYAKKHYREYTHNREDYIGLCRPCHGKYDLTNDKAERLRNQIRNLTPQEVEKLNEAKSRVAKTRQRDGKGKFALQGKK